MAPTPKILMKKRQSFFDVETKHLAAKFPFLNSSQVQARVAKKWNLLSKLEKMTYTVISPPLTPIGSSMLRSGPTQTSPMTRRFFSTPRRERNTIANFKTPQPAKLSRQALFGDEPADAYDFSEDEELNSRKVPTFEDVHEELEKLAESNNAKQADIRHFFEAPLKVDDSTAFQKQETSTESETVVTVTLEEREKPVTNRGPGRPRKSASAPDIDVKNSDSKASVVNEEVTKKGRLLKSASVIDLYVKNSDSKAVTEKEKEVTKQVTKKGPGHPRKNASAAEGPGDEDPNAPPRYEIPLSNPKKSRRPRKRPFVPLEVVSRHSESFDSLTPGEPSDKKNKRKSTTVLQENSPRLQAKAPRRSRTKSAPATPVSTITKKVVTSIEPVTTADYENGVVNAETGCSNNVIVTPCSSKIEAVHHEESEETSVENEPRRRRSSRIEKLAGQTVSPRFQILPDRVDRRSRFDTEASPSLSVGQNEVTSEKRCSESSRSISDPRAIKRGEHDELNSSDPTVPCKLEEDHVMERDLKTSATDINVKKRRGRPPGRQNRKGKVTPTRKNHPQRPCTKAQNLENKPGQKIVEFFSIEAKQLSTENEDEPVPKTLEPCTIKNVEDVGEIVHHYASVENIYLESEVQSVLNTMVEDVASGKVATESELLNDDGDSDNMDMMSSSDEEIVVTNRGTFLHDSPALQNCEETVAESTIRVIEEASDTARTSNTSMVIRSILEDSLDEAGVVIATNSMKSDLEEKKLGFITTHDARTSETAEVVLHETSNTEQQNDNTYYENIPQGISSSESSDDAVMLSPCTDHLTPSRITDSSKHSTDAQTENVQSTGRVDLSTGNDHDNNVVSTTSGSPIKILNQETADVDSAENCKLGSSEKKLIQRLRSTPNRTKLDFAKFRELVQNSAVNAIEIAGSSQESSTDEQQSPALNKEALFVWAPVYRGTRNTIESTVPEVVSEPIDGMTGIIRRETSIPPTRPDDRRVSFESPSVTASKMQASASDSRDPDPALSTTTTTTTTDSVISTSTNSTRETDNDNDVDLLLHVEDTGHENSTDVFNQVQEQEKSEDSTPDEINNNNNNNDSDKNDRKIDDNLCNVQGSRTQLVTARLNIFSKLLSPDFCTDNDVEPLTTDAETTNRMQETLNRDDSSLAAVSDDDLEDSIGNDESVKNCAESGIEVVDQFAEQETIGIMSSAGNAIEATSGTSILSTSSSDLGGYSSGSSGLFVRRRKRKNDNSATCFVDLDDNLDDESLYSEAPSIVNFKYQDADRVRSAAWRMKQIVRQNSPLPPDDVGSVVSVSSQSELSELLLDSSIASESSLNDSGACQPVPEPAGTTDHTSPHQETTDQPVDAGTIDTAIMSGGTAASGGVLCDLFDSMTPPDLPVKSDRRFIRTKKDDEPEAETVQPTIMDSEQFFV